MKDREKLRTLREAAGLAQWDAAAVAKTNRATISEFESGRVRLSEPQMNRIAELATAIRRKLQAVGFDVVPIAHER